MLPNDCWPVSVNDHIVEPKTLWTARMSKRDADLAPHVIETEDGGEAWKFGDEVLPVSFILASPHLRTDPNRRSTRFEHLLPGGEDPRARLKAMDQDQVAVHTMNSQVCGFAGERLRKLGDKRLWADAVRAYNDYLLNEFCAAAPERLVGLALLPLTDPDGMVKEIERVAPLGARGISLPHDPVPSGADSYFKDSWVRVLDAADAAGLPVFIHIGSSGVPWAPPSSPAWKPMGTMVALANLDVMIAASDLTFSPLLYDRPKRRVVFQEGNLSWMPYLEERVDFAVNKLRSDLAPKVSRPPSQIMHEQTMASFLRDPVGIAMRHQIGLDRFLWQADYPHIDGLFPDSRKELVKQLQDVPDDEARQIAEGNARKLLRLGAWSPPN